MVLPDQLHRRRLGSLVALALGNDVAHLLAFDQLVEVGIDEAVFMEIDLAPVRRLNEAVVLKTIEPGDLAVRRHLVALHAARALTRMVLEAAACRIEGIAQSDVDVLMLLVAAGVAVDPYLLAWTAPFARDVAQVTLGLMPVQVR